METTTLITKVLTLREVRVIAEKKVRNAHFLQDGNSVNVDDVTDQIHRVIVFMVIPAISILGVIGNILSITVIWKHGLRRTSDILLFSLAISDLMLLICFNAPPKAMYEWGDGGFYYSEQTAYVWYIFYHIFDGLNWIGGTVSFFLPVVITLERVIAVFFPLKFHLIVTRRRIIGTVLSIYILVIALQIYMRAWLRFEYVFDESRNASVGIAARSDLYWRHRDIVFFLGRWHNSISINGVFVFLGCVAIGIKVKHAASKRKKMTTAQGFGNDGRMSRTTKMLMVVCIFYTVSSVFIAFPAVMPNLMVFPLFEDDPNFKSVGVFVYHLMKVDLCTNASINFVIYVAMNQKFRDTLKAMFRLKNTSGSAQHPHREEASRGSTVQSAL